MNFIKKNYQGLLLCFLIGIIAWLLGKIFSIIGGPVFLETYVKTLKNWRDQEKYFLELGLKEEDI